MRPLPPFPLTAHSPAHPLTRSPARRNLTHALQLADIVADSRYRLYDDFGRAPGRRLSDYLGAVRQAVLGGLEGGGADPFRAVVL